MCFSCSVFQLIETMCTPVDTVGVYCMFASGMLVLDDKSCSHFLVPFWVCCQVWSFAKTSCLIFFLTTSTVVKTWELMSTLILSVCIIMGLVEHIVDLDQTYWYCCLSTALLRFSRYKLDGRIFRRRPATTSWHVVRTSP